MAWLRPRALHVVAPGWAADPHRLVVVIVGAVYLSVAVMLLTGLGRRAAQRRSWLALNPPDGPSLRFGAAAWTGAYAASAVLYTATGPLGLTPADALEALWAIGADNGRLNGAPLALTVLILGRVCVLAPLAEELLFRGALFTWLRQRLTASWTIAITAMGFALIHQVPAMLPLAAVVGVGAGIIRERTGSVTVPIILHAVQNVVVVVASYAVTGWQATLPS